MAKSGNKSKGGSVKPKSMSAADHRKMAETLNARARIHHAQADLMDAKNPPKKRTPPGAFC